MTETPSTEAVALAAAFKARVAEVSTETCSCGRSTTTGMLATLGHCSVCATEIYAAR